MMIRPFSNYQKISDLQSTIDNEESPNGFDGYGIPFKAKLIGMEDISTDRDEKECLESLSRLKSIVRVRGEHKQKVQLNIGLNGIQVIDESTKVELACHEIRRIPFVIMDPFDPRAFGYVYRTTDDRYQFWAIKTDRLAQFAVFALKDLFEEVYELKKNLEEAATLEDQVTLETVSLQTQKSTSQTTQVTTTPMFNDNWGGNSLATVRPSLQTFEQSSTVTTTDPWGFSEPVIPVKQPTPRVDSPVNTFILPPPPLSRRSTTPQQSAPTIDTNTLFSLFPTVPVTTPVNNNGFNSIPTSSITSPPATNLFSEFDLLDDFSSESTTDNLFFSPPSSAKSFQSINKNVNQ